MPPPRPADLIAPRTRLILGDKAGDNAQVHIIADALGWPFEVKDLVFRAPYVLGKPHFRTSLYHVDRAHSAPLEPPRPDLILTVGRRAPVDGRAVGQGAGAGPPQAGRWSVAPSAGSTASIW